MSNLPKVVMRYGTSGKTTGGGYPKFIESGDLEYEDAADIVETDLPLEAGGTYILVTRSTTKATDAYSGYATYQLNCPVGQRWEVTNDKTLQGTVVSSGTQRVTITLNNGGTASIKPSGVAYHVRYALYKIA